MVSSFKFKDLDGRWKSVLADFGINVTTQAGQPCPICGGRDRFQYTNKHNNGTYICRHCTPEGGSGFKLLMKVKSWDKAETGRQLNNKYGDKKMIQTTEPEHKIKNSFKQLPIPAGVQWDKRTLINKNKSYRFTFVWEWFDENGSLMGYIARLEWTAKSTNEKKKLVWQIVYGESEKYGLGWHQTTISNKPLVNLQSLKPAKIKQILLVEGEKNAFKVQEKLGDNWSVLCIQGGSNKGHLNKTNLSPLLSTEVPIYAWADYDNDGQKHMQDIANKGVAVKAVDIDSIVNDTQKNGWDLIDAINEGWTKKQIEEAILNASKELNPGSLQVDSQGSVCTSQIKESSSIKNEILDLARPLGLDEGKLIFYPRRLKTIRAFKANELNKNTLMLMLGQSLVHKVFQKVDKNGNYTGSIDWDACASYLIDRCVDKGLYKADMIRGIGVWSDGKDIVANTGSYLQVNGKKVEYEDYSSHYTYQDLGTEELKLDRIATDKDIDTILQAVNSLQWTRHIHSELLIGFCVQAVLGPMLSWRAHIHLGGSQGNGKSTVQDKLVRRLIAPLCIKLDSETSAAGIRQKLGHDAFAVSFDEAEIRTEKDKSRLRQIMTLIRASSSGSTIVKGSAGGTAVEYRCQSSFIFSAIKSFVEHKSDETRVASLELSVPDEHHQPGGHFYESFNEAINSIDIDFAHRFIAKCIEQAPKLQEMRKLVRELFIKYGIKSARVQDTYTQLLGCYLLIDPKANLDSWFDTFKKDLLDIKAITDDSEETQTLDKLMNSIVKIPMNIGSKEMSIRKAIKLASKHIGNSEYKSEEIEQFLLAYGIKLDKDYKSILIANRNSNLQDLIGAPNWNSLLKNIEGVDLVNKTSFGSKLSQHRAVKIPLILILDS